ncbi:MAG: hypothetical protein K940chlam1_00391 [Candidatus Anoxychlamydiales bacterium]|nr:hypothetical protein [Candidatus Anoxychlamydiales bacterium]NGX36390.1 hypothetical protein [Candidatus Anoxychlamydiales bacterium]
MSLKSSFYVQKPMDEYWNTGIPDYVIEARPIDKDCLSELEKTDKFFHDQLEIISPEEVKKHSPVNKRNWIECKGPVRKLSFFDYVTLYHSLAPKIALPEQWEECLRMRETSDDKTY